MAYLVQQTALNQNTSIRWGMNLNSPISSISEYIFSIIDKVTGSSKKVFEQEMEDMKIECLPKADKNRGKTVAFRAAEKALNKSNKLQFSSFNNLARSNILPGNTPQQQEEYAKIWKQLHSQIQAQRVQNSKQIFTLTAPNHFKEAFLDATAAKKTLLGNCYEMSCYSFFYLLERIEEKIDIYFIHDADHVFIVIGRDINSDLNDYTTWGKHAMVCDPWSGTIFPAAEMPQRLFGSNGTGEKGPVDLIPFDPQINKLGIFVSNFYSPREFDALINATNNIHAFHLSSLLSKFHNASLEQEKIEIAKKIILRTRCYDQKTPLTMEQIAFSTLYSQMKYYVELKEGREWFSSSKKNIPQTITISSQ